MFNKQTSDDDQNAREKPEISSVAFSQTSGSLQAPMVVNEILDGCLYSGFFGRLDSARIKSVTDRILQSIDQTACEIIIVDLSNIDVIDSMVAAHLAKIGDTLQIVGVRPVFCGISSVVAQTMVGTGVSFERFTVVRNLKAALRVVLEIDGVNLK
ncbi:MAG: STAS domain-containing protein [Granulosicoccus sp.]